MNRQLSHSTWTPLIRLLSHWKLPALCSSRELPTSLLTRINNSFSNDIVNSLLVDVSFSLRREVLVFMIRGFGGEVSWHSTLAVGATFTEDDSSVTHQIVDRPAIQSQVLTRTYVQVGRISVTSLRGCRMMMAMNRAVTRCCWILPHTCTTRGHHVVADGWAGAPNPDPHLNSHPTHKHTQKVSKTLGFSFFDLIIKDWRTDGRTKPFIELRVRN